MATFCIYFNIFFLWYYCYAFIGLIIVVILLNILLAETPAMYTGLPYRIMNIPPLLIKIV